MNVDVSRGTRPRSEGGTAIAVETRGLTKTYGKTVALDNLSTSVEEGKILVLLGPNGSGKTTFLHLIATVLKPTAGTASVMGYDIVREPQKVREVVAISFQDPRGFWRHKPRHILSFHASMYGVSGTDRERVVDDALREFQLWESRDKRFMTLSGGQAKRLEVAKLFVHIPKLAILDEPTAMVDLDGKRMIWDKIRSLKEKGSTVIVATNEVREAEYLADRISIFTRGREVISDTLINLKDSVKGGDVVNLEFASPVDKETVDTIRGLPGTEDAVLVDAAKVRARVSRSEDWLPSMTSTLYARGIRLASIRVEEPSLDDVFLLHTGSTPEGGG
jgi:ABC-2 type transport system ATP-binding protein